MSGWGVRALAVVGHVPPGAEADGRSGRSSCSIVRADPGVGADHGQARDRARQRENERAVVDFG